MSVESLNHYHQKMFKRYVIGALWIFGFYLLGCGLSFVTGGAIPGSVVGMVLLFTALMLGWVKPQWVDLFSRGLIRYMVLFFLPPAIAIIGAWDRVKDHITPVVATVLISTIVVIVVVSLVEQRSERIFKKDK